LKLVSLLTILLLFSVWALGQAETGTISGTVVDKTGAAVTGAKVTAVSTGTGLTRSTVTASAGEYAIPSLPPAIYNITIEAPGFQKYTAQVQVAVGSRNDVSAKLAVTGSSTTVEVTASGEVATVNTESQTLSQVVNSKQVMELPTLTRNPYDLVGTSSNVTQDNTGQNRGAGYQINGQRSDSTDVLLDGAENVSLFTAQVGQSVPLDTVQEFSVLTSNFTAEYGRASGGVVNVATKSGTNQFHGGVYEFNRVAALAANTYNNNANDLPKAGFTRNQFGYTIGGPIIKNKLFFFSGTEWTRVRSNAEVIYEVTDPAFLNLDGVARDTKDFMARYGKLRPDARVLNTINYGQALNKTSNCPLLDCSSPFAETVAYSAPSDSGGGNPQNTYSTVNRVDWNISDKSTLYGRYALYSRDYFSGVVNNSPYVGYDTGQTDFNQNVNINFTHVFSPTLVNSTKLNYNRLNQLQPLGAAPLTPGLFSTGSVPALPGTSYQYVFPGYVQTSTANALPFGGPQNLYQLYDDLSWTKGRHQFKFGGSYIQTRDNRVFGAYENAVQILGNNLTNGIQNLVKGNVYQFQGALYPQGNYPCSKLSNGDYTVTPACLINLPATEPSFARNYKFNDGSFYVQDSWKVRPRLTLNLGIRWEYYGVQHNSNPALDSNFYLGSGSDFASQVRNGTVQIADKSPVGGLWAKDTNNWAPRIGFAYDVFGDGRMSVRGGYGIGYERNFGNVTFNVIQNPPNYAVVSITSKQGANPNDVPFQPIYVDNSGAFATAGSKCFNGTHPPQGIIPPDGQSCIPNVTLRAVDPNIKTAYAQFWSFAMDYQVNKGGVLSLEYSGSRGEHLYDISNVNTQYFGSTFLGDTHLSNRNNYQYGNINWRGDSGWNYYNGFTVKYQANNLASKGLMMNAAYTWSHAIDNLSSTFTDGYNGNYSLGYTSYWFPQIDKGNSDYDIRNRFILSAVWDLPWMKNSSNSVARQVLGGWQVSPIVEIHSGYPYNIFDGTNAITIYPRWTPDGPVGAKGYNQGATGPNVFTYLTLPQGVDPNAADFGLPAGTTNALQVPSSGLAFCPNVYVPEGQPVGIHSFTCNGQLLPQRNAYSGPGYWNWDMVIAKNFKLTERFNLQFRTEMYNTFNHHNLYIASQNLDTEAGLPAIQAQKGGIYGTPGQPTDERRNIQFGLKLNF
jgi:outer membrane receptor protein involved in Fe transport